MYFDDYEPVSTYPADLDAWIANGADPNAWKTPRLARDVAALRMGHELLHPNDTTVLKPTRYLVVEELFGRERHEMAPLIDVVAVIDVPLEIALAQQIRRSFGRQGNQANTAHVIQHVDSHLKTYIEIGSAVYGSINARA